MSQQKSRNNWSLWAFSIFCFASINFGYLAPLLKKTNLAAKTLILTSAILHAVFLTGILAFLESGVLKFLEKRAELSRVINQCVYISTTLMILALAVDLLIYKVLGQHMDIALGMLFSSSLSDAINTLNATGAGRDNIIKIAASLIAAIGVSFIIPKITKTISKIRNLSFTLSAIIIVLLGSVTGLTIEQNLSKTYKPDHLWEKETNAIPYYISLVPHLLRSKTFRVRSIQPRKESVPVQAIETPKDSLVFLVIMETFPARFVTPEYAPNLWGFQNENISIKNPVSSANSTHLAWYGIYQSDYPIHWNKFRSERKWEGSPVIRVFRDAGYRIHVFTKPLDWAYFQSGDMYFGNKTALAEKRDLHFFDQNVPEADYRSFEAATKVAQKTQGKGKHLFVIYSDVLHHNYDWPTDWPARHQPFIKDFNYYKWDYSVDDVKRIRNRFLNSLAYFDEIFGSFLQRLKTANLYSSATIGLIGDHGEEFMEHGALIHGSNLYNTQIGTGMILRTASAEKRTIEHPVSQISFLPTLLDAAGIKLGDKHELKRLSFLNSDEHVRIRSAIAFQSIALKTPYRGVLQTPSYKFFFELDRKDPTSSRSLQLHAVLTKDDKPLSLHFESEAAYSKFLQEEFVSYMSRDHFIKIEEDPFATRKNR